MGTRLDFRNPPPAAPSKIEVHAIIEAPPMPAGWSRTKDHEMFRSAFTGFSLNVTEAARFHEIRRALVGDAALGIDLQITLMQVLERLDDAGRHPPPALESGPWDDACGICGGHGTYSEPSQVTPGATLTSPCWKCHGTGRSK